ncbi:unnamed protein product [Ophioblennius macclurei]
MSLFKFLKAAMIFFNAIIFLAGAAVLGVGIWVKVDDDSILSFLGKIENVPSELSQVLNVGYLLIVLGALLLIIGFLGCCGAIKENKCMLFMFFAIILLVFLAEVAGAIVVLVFQPLANDLLTQLGTAAVQSIRDSYGSDEDITGLWDTTMTALSCCGFFNASDFVNSPFYNNQGMKFPPHCCPGMSTACNQTVAEGNEAISGCYPKVSGIVANESDMIVGVALGIAALEICAMVVSMILFCKIKSGRRG